MGDIEPAGDPAPVDLSVSEAVDILVAAIERDRAAGRRVDMPFPVEALHRIAVSDTAASLAG